MALQTTMLGAKGVLVELPPNTDSIIPISFSLALHRHALPKQ
jgi:hypothetical protein